MPDVFEWYGPEVEAKIREGAMRGVTEAIGIVEQAAIRLILDTPKSGRVYKRRGVVHQASAPGEPPASDTGTLVNARAITLDQADVSALLTFNSRHAAYLEFGTRRMAPRPFARRAVMETKDQVLGAVERNVAQAIRG